jgi:hypothetical protein
VEVSVWATVVAALGGSALTGTVALVVPAVQRRYSRQDTAATERATAYEDFANAAVAFAFRVEMGVGALRLRSGLSEGVSVLLLRWRPIEPVETFDRMYRDFQPLQQAWSKIQTVGSQAVIDAAGQVIDACVRYIESAMSPDKTLGPVSRALRGEVWTSTKTAEVEAARRALFAAREQFINVVRTELDREPVVLPIARSKHESR